MCIYIYIYIYAPTSAFTWFRCAAAANWQAPRVSKPLLTFIKKKIVRCIIYIYIYVYTYINYTLYIYTLYIYSYIYINYTSNIIYI